MTSSSRKRAVLVSVAILVAIAIGIALFSTGVFEGEETTDYGQDDESFAANSPEYKHSAAHSDKNEYQSTGSSQNESGVHATRTDTDAAGLLEDSTKEKHPESTGTGDESSSNDKSKEDKASTRVACNIHGTVTLDGKPQPNVHVFVGKFGIQGGARTVTTDHEGKYRVEGLTRFGYTVSARVPSGFGHGRLVDCDGSMKEMQADLDYKKASVHVTGRVTDFEDNPLADSEIEVWKSGHERDVLKSLLYPTDIQGRFEFWLPDDATRYGVAARAIGHLYQIKRVPPHQSEVELVFRMPRQSVIHGTVVGPGGPKADVSVHYSIKLGGNSSVGGSTISDKNGKFVIECGPGPVKIGAWDGRLWGHVTVPARKEAQDRYDVVVELNPGRTIKGLIHLADKKPVPMGEVLFHCPTTAISDTVQADMNGIFEIGGLPPDEIVTISPWNDKRPIGKKGEKKVGPEQSYVEILLVPEED